MASKHWGVSPLESVTAKRPSLGTMRWRRRLHFEALEDRRLLATITVNTTVDENNGTGNISLREAVGMANTGDTINFSVTGTINLQSSAGGQISIGKSMTIQGPGANLLTIRAFDPDAGGANNSNGSRMFLVEDNFATLNVAINGLTLTNGDPQIDSENGGGGAILNRENLTLNNCVLSGNFSTNGGAILTDSGTLTINDCTISANNSAADGAGILIQGGSLVINRTTISNNQATNSGGGILSRGRPVTITDSTISGNSTDEFGGGIYQYQGSLSVSGSTISSNTADNNHDNTGSGGGIYNAAASLSVVNSTISGNSAGDSGGGGIFSDTLQTVAIKFSTITGNVIANTNGSTGGGINSGSTASLDHTIVAGNLRGASTRDDVSGSFDAFYSLIGDKRSAAVNNTGDSLIGTTASPINAMLGPLANNGGLTLTHALLSGSPALEAGNPAAVAGSGGVPQFDQRGTPFSRVVDFDGTGGARIDIGAMEMAATAPALPGDYNLNHSVDAADYVLWRKTTGSSVAQAYSGADGDGNSVVNSVDYAVWRAHFGNTSSGMGSTGQSIEVAPATQGAVARMFGTDAAPIPKSQAVEIDGAIELLLLIGSNNTRVNKVAAEFSRSVSATSAMNRRSFDLLVDETNFELLNAWQGDSVIASRKRPSFIAVAAFSQFCEKSRLDCRLTIVGILPL